MVDEFIKLVNFMIESPARFLVSSFLIILFTAVIAGFLSKLCDAIQSVKDEKIELFVRRYMDALIAVTHKDDATNDDKE